MRRYSYIILIFLFTLFFFTNVHGVFASGGIFFQTYLPANSLNLVYESDIIQNKDLTVHLTMSLNVPYSVKDYSNVVKIVINPSYFMNKPLPVINNFFVCEGTVSGSNYFDSSYACTNNVSYSINTTYDSYNYAMARITINLPNETFQQKSYVIKMDYLLKNFVFEEGNFNIAWFNSQCNQNGDCSQNWYKFITLPHNFVIQDLSGSVQIRDRVVQSWILQMQGNGPVFIRFYNPSWVNNWQPFIIGALAAFIVASVVEFIKYFHAHPLRLHRRRRQDRNFSTRFGISLSLFALGFSLLLWGLDKLTDFLSCWEL